jgi:hypothetical protein
MKKQIALVLTLVVSLLTACDNTDPGPTTPPDVTPHISQVTVIRSVYPSVGTPGSTVAIFGENFGPTVSENYVTFDSVSADITYVGYGVLNVRVPENLADGDYSINLNAEGRQTSAPSMFKVTNSPY